MKESVRPPGASVNWFYVTVPLKFSFQASYCAIRGIRFLWALLDFSGDPYSFEFLDTLWLDVTLLKPGVGPLLWIIF